MKLFNLSAVALLSTMPLANSDIISNGKTYEVKLDSANDKYEKILGIFAQNLVDFVADPDGTTQGVEELRQIFSYVDQRGNYATNHTRDEMIAAFNTSYPTTPTINEIVEDLKETYNNVEGIETTHLTINYGRGTVNDFDYFTSTNDQEVSAKFTPLEDIDVVSWDAYLGWGLTNPTVEVDSWGVRINYDDGDMFSPSEQLLKQMIYETLNLTGFDILVGSTGYETDFKLFGFEEDNWDDDFDRRNFDVQFQVGDDEWDTERVSNKFLHEITDAGITGYSGGSMLAWLIFMIPSAALFGPLISKKVTDHKMKKMVGKI